MSSNFTNFENFKNILHIKIIKYFMRKGLPRLTECSWASGTVEAEITWSVPWCLRGSRDHCPCPRTVTRMTTHFRELWNIDTIRVGHHLHLTNQQQEQTIREGFKNKPYDKVLGAAQFIEHTSISCQKLLKFSKVVKVVNSCQQLSTVVKSCQKLS